MSISAIRPLINFEQTSSFEKSEKTSADTLLLNKNYGPDTVSFSEEAIMLAQKSSQLSKSVSQNVDQSSDDGSAFKLSSDSSEKPVSSKKANDFSKSIFSMLLESLFLAELEEGEAASTDENTQSREGSDQNSEDSGSKVQSKKNNPLQDNKKSAQIKNVLEKFSKGKADLGDVAVAVGGGSASSNVNGKKAVAETSVEQKNSIL